MYNLRQAAMSNQYKLNSLRLCLLHTFLLLVLTGCLDDAPHSNPLDPANGDKVFGLSGQVRTYYAPHKPISGATIYLQPGDQVVITNAEGEYQFDDLSKGQYELICSVDGYHTDSSVIDLDGNFEYDFYLDGLPQFDHISLTTHHISRWFPMEDTYFMELKTMVSDPDGLSDIRKVTARVHSIDYADSLQPGLQTGIFKRTLYDRDLPVSSIHRFVGKPFEFIVEDELGMRTISDPIYITRIIEQTPVLTSPSELKMVNNPSIQFEWQRLDVVYSATFTIKIFKINFGVAIKVDEVANIAIDDISYQYQSSLDEGDYYWTISIVDEFGNSSSSKEGTFKVE